MPANNQELDAAIQDAVDNAAKLEGQVPSIISILGSVGDQIVAALVADNTIDQANTDRAVSNVRSVVSRNQATAQKIADAIAANSATPPIPPAGQ